MPYLTTNKDLNMSIFNRQNALIVAGVAATAAVVGLGYWAYKNATGEPTDIGDVADVVKETASDVAAKAKDVIDEATE